LRRALILALGTAFCAAPLAQGAAAPAPLTKAPATKAPAYKAPRNAFGQPDLSGVWNNATLTPLTRQAKFGLRATYTPEEVKALEGDAQREVVEGNQPTDPNAPATAKNPSSVALRPQYAAAGGDTGGYNRGWLDPGSAVMRVGGEPRNSLLTTPDGQFPPRKAGAPPMRGYRSLGSFDNPEQRPLGERCIMGFGRNAGPPMLPNGFYNDNYQIVQTGDAVVIDVEMVHDVRIVRLNSKHRTDGVRPWMGDSIGWWEGDTLVVETTNIPQAEELAGAWKDLKVTERFTRVGKDRLRYAFTVEDPMVWDKPWGGEYEFAPLNGVIYEYACHEGNYALPSMLSAARQAERDAAKARAGEPSGSQP